MKNDILKIVFQLKGRKIFVNRYLDLIQTFSKDQIKFDFLIIRDLNTKTDKKKLNLTNKIIIRKSGLKYNINGINDIFKSILINTKILKNYKYLCFVEDDNFVFPNGLSKCKEFMENNSSFISSNGKSFLISKKKNYYYLNHYNLPNTINSKKLIKRARQYKGGIFYYSLFKRSTFIEILRNVIKVKDNNLSEIFFNFLAIKFGNHKNLNKLFLAREYPRPSVYNIPNPVKWISNEKLYNEINILIKVLTKNIKIKDTKTFLNITLFQYLSERLNLLKKKDYTYSQRKLLNTKIDKISYHIEKLNKISNFKS